jgi:hypothetical protein
VTASKRPDVCRGPYAWLRRDKQDLAVDWVATLVVLGALGLGACFMGVQCRTLWHEVEMARREKAVHPDPQGGRKMVRAIVIVVVLYGGLGISFYIGWRQGGIRGGALAVVAVAVVGVLVAAGYAVKSAWVSRK